jgi:histidinol-phosphatase (PHP family)
MLDYHLHLWEHGPRSLEVTLEQVAAYCDRATAAGVVEVALTEHLSRFRQADAVLKGWWDDDPSPALAAAMRQAWDEEVGADLDEYVEVVLAAKAAGLPVVLGLEVDHYAGRMDVVGDLLAGYPFDVLLGSVHWIGSWGFDNWFEPAFADEWDRRGVEAVWDAYTDALEELAASGACDVLAHPDLCKVTGRRPAVPNEWYDRMAEAAARCGLAAEV